MLGERGHGPLDSGARDYDDVRAALLASGAEMREISVGQWAVSRTLVQALESIEHRTWASSRNVPEGFFAERLAELRRWAEAELGALDQAYRVEQRFVWQMYRWPEA